MGDRQARKTGGRRVPALAWLPIDDQSPRSLPSPQLSWWEIGRGWLRYHTIQMRWRFERRLARLLGKRWGS